MIGYNLAIATTRLHSLLEIEAGAPRLRADESMPKTILITGAYGFLARTIASQAPPEWCLIGLVRPGSSMDAAHGFERLYDSPEAISSSGVQVDAVLHLAAHIPRDMQQFDPQLAANVELPSQLIRHHPAARHVLASSVSVYSLPPSLPMSIASPTRPTTPYGWSKLAAEHLVHITASHAVLRLSSIIGRGMRAGSFIPSAVAAAKNGSITVYGDGSRTQDYIDVRDAARMCIAAAQRTDNFVTLAVSGQAHSNAEVANALSKLTGATIQFAGNDCSVSFAYTLAGAVELSPCLHSLGETLECMVAK